MMGPQVTIHNPIHTHWIILPVNPTALRYAPCAARVSSESSCVYRSSVVWIFECRSKPCTVLGSTFPLFTIQLLRL